MLYMIPNKKTSAEIFYHCAHAWQTLVEEFRTSDSKKELLRRQYR
jgi:hypothetical protein